MAKTVTTCCALGIVADVSAVIIIWVTSIVIRQVAKPFHRGFFKDDQSLMHPYKEGTIPASVLYGVGFGLPSLIFILVEGLWMKVKQREDSGYMQKKSSVLIEWLSNIYKVGVVFYFGTGVTHLSTNIPKYTIGRLRPHFLTVCNPDYSRLNDTTVFIEESICRLGYDWDRLQEARVSFPSGHASMAVYCMLFLSLYLQRRWTWQGLVLLRPFLQTVFLCMAFYTCLSRISDYKHHWSDVLFGGLLGAVVAVLVIYSIGKNSMPPVQSPSSTSERGMLVQKNNSSIESPLPQSTAL